MKPTKKFAGALAERIEAPKPVGIIRSAMPQGREKHLEDEALRIRSEFDVKLAQLALHYGIAPTGNYFPALALALAIDYVPGFSIATKRGAPKRWPDFLRAALVVKMNKLIEPRTEKGPTHAARLLRKREPWIYMVEDLREPVEALLNVYKKAVKTDSELICMMESLDEKLDRSGQSRLDALIEQYIYEITGKKKSG